MKAIKKLKLVILSLVIGSTALSAQEPEIWSLEKCVKYALDNNIQIKQQQLNAKISEADLVEAKGALYPNLNAGLNHGYVFGRSPDPYTNEYSNTNAQTDNFYLGSELTLFKGLQNYNTLKQTRFDLLANLQNIDKIKNDVSLNVASTYLQILYNEEILKVAKEQLEVTKLQVDRTRKLVDAGRVAMGYLLEIQSQQAQEELMVINAENEVRTSYLNLTQLMELEKVSNFVIQKMETTPGEDNLLSPVDSIFAVSKKVLPQIKSAEYVVKSAERRVDIAKGYYLPSLSLSANYFTDARKLLSSQDDLIPTKSLNQQLKDNASQSLTFRLSIPIFNNFRINSGVSRAKVNQLMAQENLQLAKNQVYKEIQLAHNEAQAAHHKFIASKKAVEASEEAFKYAEQKYSVGLINSVEYSTAKNQLTKVKSDLVQSKYNFVFRKAVLDFYMGNPIKL